MMKIALQLLMTPSFWLCMVFVPPLLKFILFILFNIIKLVLPQKKLRLKYCPDNQQSWAIIAKANNQIGLGFCKQLIRQGINIICVGDNTEQLSSTIQSMETYKSQVKSTSQLKNIHFDFQNASNLQKLKQFTDQLTGLDICMLINNIQERKQGLLSQTTIRQNIKIVNTNCIAVALLTHNILKNMVKRKQKSAIIHVSSIQSLKGMSKLSLYSSTKRFVNRLSEGISFEYDKLDILNLMEIFVDGEEDKSLLSTSPQSFARAGLRQLAFESQSFGPFINQVFAYIYTNFIPDIIYKHLVSSFLTNIIINRHNNDDQKDLKNKMAASFQSKAQTRANSKED